MNLPRVPFSILLFLFITANSVIAQNIYSEKKFQFLSFEKIPTWVGVAANWDADTPQIHLYDQIKYKGHAQYISVALKTGITFKQFKEQVKKPDARKYLPFFLFDLRDIDVNIAGLRYEWAVRIEDYRYEDNQQQMTETTLRLLNSISEYIGKQSGKSSKGIIVLATNTEAKPNTSIAEVLNMKGFPNMTQSELLALAGGKKVEVLNPGTGVGYLRYVAADQQESIHPAVEDILIYENLPERVPPVAGIITLEPQTPLSHINLLAINRGTINLYATDLKYLPGAGLLINKLVKIVCAENRITITEADENEAKAFWAARIHKIEIPEPLVTEKSLVDLNTTNPAIQSTQHIGAKASNYALIRQSFPKYVRPGYAIPFSFYFNTIKSCGADTLIRNLVQQKPDVDERNQQLKKIRKAITGATISQSLISDLKTLITEQFHNARIRLRSSTNCEDLPEFNGAGLYRSAGFDIADGDAKLARKILQVYASLWTPLAFEEREFYLIDHTRVGMAILINEAFSDEYANGVALTMMENGVLSLSINSQFGENSVTNPEGEEIPESLFFKCLPGSDFEIKSKSSIHDVFVGDSLKSLFVELRDLMIAVHQSLTRALDKTKSSSFGVDVEFRVMIINGEYRLYIKQARLLQIILPE